MTTKKWNDNSKTGYAGWMKADVTHRRLTPKGEATRSRIVEAAARLMLEGGVARTTIEDIQQAAQVSASQMYHYFKDKNALVLAVIDRETDLVLGVQQQGLDRVGSIAALRKWRDLIVGVLAEAGCVGGCPLGSLASDLSEIDPIARARLAQSFERWEELLRDGFTAMRRTGELEPTASPDDLAVAMLAAVQGGLLLSQVRRNTKPLEIAVDTMIAHVQSVATTSTTATAAATG